MTLVYMFAAAAAQRTTLPFPNRELMDGLDTEACTFKRRHVCGAASVELMILSFRVGGFGNDVPNATRLKSHNYYYLILSCLYVSAVRGQDSLPLRGVFSVYCM